MQSTLGNHLNRRRNDVLYGLMLVLASAICYVPSLQNGFVFDDEPVFMTNHAITSSGGWLDIWIGKGTPDFFPLTYSLFKGGWILWGASPPAFHGVDIFLHLIGVLLLWRLLICLGIRGAFWGAALFALHPVHVATVAWVSEIKNTLSLPFALGATLVFFSIPGGCTFSLRRYYLSIILFLSSLLAKTTSVPLPIVWGLILMWQKRFSFQKSVPRLIPFLGASLLTGIITLWFQTHHVIHHHFAELSLDPCHCLIRAAWATGFYIRQIVWPNCLSMRYGNRGPWDGDPGAWIVLSGSLLVTFWALLRRREPWARGWLVAYGSYLLLLLPVLGFLPMYYLRLAPVADHWSYLPSIPLLALTAALLTEGRFPRYRLLFMVCLITLLGVISWHRCHLLKSSESLWRSVLLNDPSNSFALQNLAIAYGAREDYPKALWYAKEATRLHPDEFEAQMNLVAFRYNSGDYSQGLLDVDKALERWNDADFWILKGRFLAQLQRHQEAITCLEMGLSTDPYLPQALFAVAKEYFAMMQPSPMIPHLTRLVELHPDDVDAWNLLGGAHALLGQYLEAENCLLRAQKIDPNNAATRANLDLLQQQSRTSE